MSNLYHVQDSDRPMYVVAQSWQGAINKWKVQVAKENDMQTEDVGEPSGIHLVAESDDLILGGDQ